MATKNIPPIVLAKLKYLLTRRDFLRFLSSGLFIAALPPLTGCGGGSNGSPPPGGNPPGDTVSKPGAGVEGAPVSEAQRLTALQGVETKVDELLDGDRHFDPDALISFLQQQTAFHEVGYSYGSNCAWAVFTDGRKLLIINNLNTSVPPAPLSAATATPLAKAAAVSSWPATNAAFTPPSPIPIGGDFEPLITAPQFRLINMWANAAFWKDIPLLDYLHVSGDWVDEDTIPNISILAGGLGFDVVPPGMIYDFAYDLERPLIADVSGLMNVSGDGVFFLTGSGGYMDTRDGRLQAICTMTSGIVGETVNEDYAFDLDTNALIYSVAVDHLSPDSRTYLAITPQFIYNHNWSFPSESLVFLNVTGGGIGDWLDAFYAANAGIVMGWTNPPNQRTMLGVAEDLFELLFATNRVSPSWTDLTTEPRLRSYGLLETYDYLSRKQLLNITKGDMTMDRMVILPSAANLYINQLRPSIEWLGVSETVGEIQLQGQFGTQTADSKVIISTNTLPIKDPVTNAEMPEFEKVADKPLEIFDYTSALPIIEWQPSLIRLDATHSDRLKSGMVQVWQGTRYSNIVHLTLWPIRFQVTRTVGGSLQRSVTLDLKIRGFVSSYRLWPGQSIDDLWTFTAMNNMVEGDIGWSASGSRSISNSGTTTTVTWSGSGGIHIDTPPNDFFYLNGILWIKERRLDCNLQMQIADALHITTTSVSTTGEGSIEEDALFEIKSPNVGDISPYNPVVGALTLNFGNDWTLYSGDVTFPDNDESVLGFDNCETQIKWNAVTPEFPPELDRGGR